MARHGIVHRVDDMSSREILINNIANTLINTYEDKGAACAASFYFRNVAGSDNEKYIVDRVKVLNGHS
ncbi:hypothetical protein NVP1208B_36 [Vibrio phage 1.208.B._10N.222.52.A7]|nr:hypothetical protein NVP1208B_36 [Vibrio phage 1.208.B._10N.222.52.A7]